MTVGRRLAGTAVLAVIVGACGGDSQVDVAPTVTQAAAGAATTTVATESTTAATATEIEPDPVCGGDLPVFPSTVAGSVAADYLGTQGTAAGMPPAEPGQLVVHWELPDGVTVEVRWPGGTPPADSQPLDPIDELMAIGEPVVTDAGFLLVADYRLDDNPVDPCARLAVNAAGPAADPLHDELRNFLEGLRPIATLDDVVAAVTNRPGLDDCLAAPPPEPRRGEVRVYVECGATGSLPLFPVTRPTPEGSTELEAALLGLVRGTATEERELGLGLGFDWVDQDVSPYIEVTADVDAAGVARIDFTLDGERWGPGSLAGTSAQLFAFVDPLYATVFQFEEVTALDMSNLCWGEMGCQGLLERSGWETMTFINRMTRVDPGCPLYAAWGDEECWLGSPATEASGRGVVVNVAADDTLRVRAGPGVEYFAIEELEPGAYLGTTAIIALAADGGTWRVIHTLSGYPGWVNDGFVELIDE